MAKRVPTWVWKQCFVCRFEMLITRRGKNKGRRCPACGTKDGLIVDIRCPFPALEEQTATYTECED